MSTDRRRFSFIMTIYNQEPELREHLPSFLTQEYEPGYEVIVVDETSTDNTEEVLKLNKTTYPHLYSTFLPKPNKLVMRRKLAFSIGVKASKYEWVILTQITNGLAASDILQAIDQAMDAHAELTLGYITKKGIRLQPYTSFYEARHHIIKAERILKHVFERKRLGYMMGRYDFIIIRKDLAYDLLKYYEQKIPWTKLICLRMRLFWENLMRRGSTTLLVTT